MKDKNEDLQIGYLRNPKGAACGPVVLSKDDKKFYKSQGYSFSQKNNFMPVKEDPADLLKNNNKSIKFGNFIPEPDLEQISHQSAKIRNPITPKNPYHPKQNSCADESFLNENLYLKKVSNIEQLGDGTVQVNLERITNKSEAQQIGHAMRTMHPEEFGTLIINFSYQGEHIESDFPTRDFKSRNLAKTAPSIFSK